jgi:hypothetical protein
LAKIVFFMVTEAPAWLRIPPPPVKSQELPLKVVFISVVAPLPRPPYAEIAPPASALLRVKVTFSNVALPSLKNAPPLKEPTQLSLNVTLRIVAMPSLNIAPPLCGGTLFLAKVLSFTFSVEFVET